MLEEKTTYHRSVLHNCREALRVAGVLRLAIQKSQQTMEEIQTMTANVPPDTSIHVGGDDSSRTRYCNLLEEAKSSHERVAPALEKGARNLKAMDERIRIINDDIDGEISILATLEASKTMVHSSIEQRAHAISLKRRIISVRLIIPEEIWAKIFEISVADEEMTFIEGSRHELPPFKALKLSTVCKSWRNIVTSRSNLWRYLAIPHRHQLSPLQCARLAHCITLCRPYMPIMYTYSTEPGSLEGSVTLFSYLSQRISCYEAIYTFGDFFSLDEELDFAPRAGTLCITPRYQTKMGPHPDDEEYMIFLSSLAYIDRLELRSTIVELMSSFDGPEELPNLQTLIVSNIVLYSEELVDWISMMPGLTCMKLPGVAIGMNLESTTEEATTSLECLTCSISQYTAISKWIIAPHLARLTLLLQDEPDPDLFRFDDDILAQYTDSTNESISYLTLSIPLDAEEDIDANWFVRDPLTSEEGEDGEEEPHYTSILRHFQAVSCLQFDGRVLLSVLATLSTDKASLPNLHSLTISNSDVQESTLSTFLSGYHALRQRSLSVSLVNCTNLDADAVKRLEGMFSTL
ncbi:hypothetical protein PIIN_09654 [Serendipita indica DSM 11827]|uniref:F-box domain-containing protein n=1 Tax=Serendipita indica (strain DSM 11827) TaxID=1109443 RepID=G4TWH1_SERID|nr:hypothetical protein PIIN_09654 [Serendipita indica DSM 11827]